MGEVECEYTDEFPRVLEELRCSLLISTYQAGKVVVVGVHCGELEVSFLDFAQPMGISVCQDCIAVGSDRQIHFLHPVGEALKSTYSDDRFDGAFVARSSVYTGSIHGHDLAWGREGLWIVNTLFSALCTLDDGKNFVPRWQPPFIGKSPRLAPEVHRKSSRLASEVGSLWPDDCCHLNGLAMQSGEPAFVSMLAACGEPAGWRNHKLQGGSVMDVRSSNVVCSQLCMPHSPRVYRDQLWLLNSGCGEIGFVELSDNRFVAVETMPGFLRGLSFVGDYAFVGL